MRIRALQLIAYGHFSDCTLDLPPAARDFHVIVGGNEAGKSTSLAALGDLLFGIPTRSAYGFRHEYSAMRIGGVLEHESQRLELLRRKRQKHTLSLDGGQSFETDDTVLQACLGHVQREFFERMFALDYERLTQGGHELLKADDDVAQMLFSAGSGIAGLRPTLARLGKDAEQLWSPRRGSTRRYYIAEDRLKTADKALREHQLPAGEWDRLVEALEAAESAHEAVESAWREVAAELGRVSRRRRVFRDVTQLGVLQSRISELGGSTDLPSDARARYDDAERALLAADERAAELGKHLERVGSQLQALTPDESLLRRAEDLKLLNEQRLKLSGRRQDLPRLEAELQAQHGRIHVLASELGWQTADLDQLASALPGQLEIEQAKRELQREGRLEEAVRSARMRQTETRLEHQALEADLARQPALLDATGLRQVISSIREAGDLEGQAASAAMRRQDAEAALTLALSAARPAIANEGALRKPGAPGRAELQDFAQQAEQLAQAARALAEEQRTTRADLEQAQLRAAQLRRDPRVVGEHALRDARAHRDALWQRLRHERLDGPPPADQEARAAATDSGALTDAFDAALEASDRLADQRFESAEAAAELAAVEQRVERLESRLSVLLHEHDTLAAERAAHEAHWRALWADTEVDEILAPAAMLEWLDARARASDALQLRDEAQRQDQHATRLRDAACARLRAATGATVDDEQRDAQAPLPLLLQRASEELETRDHTRIERARLEQALHKSTLQCAERDAELSAAEAALADWRERWLASTAAMGFAAQVDSDAVTARFRLFDELRAACAQARKLRDDDLGRLERERAVFESEAVALLRVLAPDRADDDVHAAIAELHAGLHQAEQVQTEQRRLRLDLQRTEKDLATLQAKRLDSEAVLAQLMVRAGVAQQQQLGAAIERAEQLRAARRALDETQAKLLEDGDGLSLADLTRECEGADPDQLAATESGIRERQQALRIALDEAVERRKEARDALTRARGGQAAVLAAADRQAALAEMREAAERYARVRGAAMLLEWVIEQYRKDKQGPMLTRASELFQALTNSSFYGLELDYDDKDQLQLRGTRGDGASVAVSGMSTGSADQLYLALRLAAVEEYLERGQILPFVADDLFINFDDQRAAAGLAVLGELSRRTQVLFFTHHTHLAELAREVLGEEVNVVPLRANADPDAAGNPP